MVEQDIIADEIKASLEDDGRLTCAMANKIARELEVEPIEVGDAATGLDIQTSHCQLGLFGHGPTGEGKGRIVKSGMEVSDELAGRIRGALMNGRLPCSVAWEIASELKMARLELGNAAETLDIRVSPCQLGFF
jgi:hypothetical protein